MRSSFLALVIRPHPHPSVPKSALSRARELYRNCIGIVSGLSRCFPARAWGNVDLTYLPPAHHLPTHPCARVPLFPALLGPDRQGRVLLQGWWLGKGCCLGRATWGNHTTGQHLYGSTTAQQFDQRCRVYTILMDITSGCGVNSGYDVLRQC